MAKKKEPIKGTTSSGFSYTIDPERLDDYRLFELLSEATEDAIKMPKFVARVLGNEQKEALLTHLEDKEGRVSLDKMEKEMVEIFSQSAPTKNS